MRHVLVLTGKPGDNALTESVANDALAALRRLGGYVGGINWLSAGTACDITFEAIAAPLAETAAREALGGAPVDANTVETEGRRKRLLVADMDSTMIGQECIDELADIAGVKSEIAAITERAMAGDLDFEDALRARIKKLAGLSESAVEEVLRDRISYTPGGRALVATMTANGATTALVSGGFTVFTARVAEALGFHSHHANVLRFDGGRLAGVAEPVLGRAAKRQTLIALSREHDIATHETMAVGDGANDLAMIAAAGLGVAYHARPKVAAAANARIDHGDLTALLYLQGYTEAEITTG
jgi:phosphoserine phosphatase